MMRRWFHILCLLWLGGSTGALLLFAPTSLANTPTSHRVALVIGAKDYQHVRSLDNTLNDSRKIRDKLQGVGFEVVYEENPTRDSFIKAINRFEDRLRKDSVALVYFAGHGAEVRGENFLIPVDAKGRRRDDIEHEAIPLRSLINKFNNIGSELNFVILDACRDDPFPSAGRSGSGGLSEVKNAPKGTLIAYAAAPGQKAIDGLKDGENGVYTAALLRQIDQPGKKIEEVFKDVRAEVVRLTNSQQTPWENSSLVGDFYFVPRQQVAIAVVPPPAPDRSVDLELTFWNSIKDSTTLSDFEAYLEQFPKGTFAPLARSRVNALKRTAQEAAKPKPEPPALPKPQIASPDPSPAKPNPAQTLPPVATASETGTKPSASPTVPATQSQGSSTPAPDKKPEAIHSLAYFDGKRLYGNSGGASPWIIDLRVKGNSIQVESLIVMVANRPFSLSCGGLFSGGLKVADDLSVRGECTGEQNNRQVSGKLPQLVISDVANSQYDGRWPGSTAPGASLLLIDDAQRSGFLAASKGQSLSTQEWANQDVRK